MPILHFSTSPADLVYVDPTLECVALTDCIVIIIFIANFLVFLILFIFGKLAKQGRQTGRGEGERDQSLFRM